jgi:hypothetical protein
MTDTAKTHAKSFSLLLKIAALHNFGFACIAVFSPSLFFSWAGMHQPLYPELWQFIGIVVGIFGIGYWIASPDPIRHWPVVLLGFLGKVIAPLYFLLALTSGRWTLISVIPIAADLVWWLPFAWILFSALSYWNDPKIRGLVNPDTETWASEKKQELLERSKSKPQLIAFLRHTGCTFCKEALTDLFEADYLSSKSVDLHIVNMVPESDGARLLEQYKLSDAHYIADPSSSLYRSFGVNRATFSNFLAPKTFQQAMRATFRGKHIPGKLAGDGLQMPGIFLLEKGTISEFHLPETPGEQFELSRVCAHIRPEATPSEAL